MKRKVLNNFIKQSICISLVCASFGGAVGAQQVYADTSSLTETAKTLDIEIDNQTIIPQEDEIKTQNDVLLFAEGNLISTPDGILNYKDSTYLPLRKIGEALGAEVKWYEQEKIAQVDLNGRIVEIFSQHYKSVVTVNGNSEVRDVTAKVDGKEVKLPSILQKGSLYLPTRFVSESLGLSIKWHNSHPETGHKTITIGKHEGLNYKKPEIPKVDLNKIPIKNDAGGITYLTPINPDWDAKTITIGKHEGLNYKKPEIPKVDLNKIPIKNDAGGITYLTPINPDWDAFFSQVNVGSGATPIKGQFYISKGYVCPIYDHNGDGYIGGPSTKYYAKISELGKIDREELKKYQGAENNLYANNKLPSKPTKPGSYDGQETPDGAWEYWKDLGGWTPNPKYEARTNTLAKLWRTKNIATTRS